MSTRHRLVLHIGTVAFEKFFAVCTSNLATDAKPLSNPEDAISYFARMRDGKGPRLQASAFRGKPCRGFLIASSASTCCSPRIRGAMVWPSDRSEHCAFSRQYCGDFEPREDTLVIDANLAKRARSPVVGNVRYT